MCGHFNSAFTMASQAALAIYQFLQEVLEPFLQALLKVPETFEIAKFFRDDPQEIT